MQTQNGYKQAGQKMTSRFGMSHRQARAQTRRFMQSGWFDADGPKRGGGRVLPRRLAKKCKHIKWVDQSYGGPESGCVAGYCKHCGYSHHVTLY